MSWLQHLFDSIGHFFSSPKAKAAEATIERLLPAAISIVSEIAQLAPNRTLTEINTIAAKYALPTLTALTVEGANVGNVLLNLATDILKKNHAPDVAISLLNTIVQLAVTAFKSK